MNKNKTIKHLTTFLTKITYIATRNDFCNYFFVLQLFSLMRYGINYITHFTGPD